MRWLALAALIALAASSAAQELKRQDTERSDTERLRNQCVDLYRVGDDAACATLRILKQFGYPAPQVELSKCEAIVTSCHLKGLWPVMMDSPRLIPGDVVEPGAVRVRAPRLPDTRKE